MDDVHLTKVHLSKRQMICFVGIVMQLRESQKNSSWRRQKNKWLRHAPNETVNESKSKQFHEKHELPSPKEKAGNATVSSKKSLCENGLLLELFEHDY
jgi:hypothetical protein